MIVEELLLCIGYRPTMELLQGWGGRKLYVPHDIPPDHPLSMRLGPYLSGRIAALYGGSTLELPQVTGALRESRNQEIRRRYLAGESKAEIAKSFGLSARMVRKIVSDNS
jgi:hypothetical protein